MKLKLKVKKLDIFALCYLCLVFQPYFQSTFKNGILHTIAQYSDDLIVMIMLMLLIVKVLRSKLKLNSLEKEIIISYIIFELLGIIYGLFNCYQTAPKVLLDAFTCAKFLILFFAAKKLGEGKINENWSMKLNNISKVVAVLFFVLTLHELLFNPFFEKAEYRYFTYSIQLFFSHPETLARVSAAFIYPLAYNMKFGEKNMKYIMMLSFVMLLTFRAKSIAIAIVILAIYFYHNKMHGRRIQVLLGAIAVISLIVGYNQIDYYYSKALIGRTKLLTDSVRIANNMFPFGSGFGSFGSNVALDYDSLLYKSMGYFNEENPWAYRNYLNDAFWPIVIAQTGWIGFLFFVYAIYGLLKIGIVNFKKDFYISWLFISIVIYDLVSSFASSAFFHPLAMSAYLFLGLLMAGKNNKKIEEIKEFDADETSIYNS